MEDKYHQRDKHFILGSQQLIEFESEEIKLDIPMEGTILKEGWKITPLTEPEVSTVLLIYHQISNA